MNATPGFLPPFAAPLVAASPDPNRFDYLFPNLQNTADLLPESPATVSALKQLGNTMSEPGTDPTRNSAIPAAYTYFGQFIDHDITLMSLPRDIKLDDPNLAPLAPSDVQRIRNVRTATFDLDCVYSEAPHASDDLMLLGLVAKDGPRPAGKVGNDFDLPRQGRSPDPAHDRTARIGDGRNEENAIIAQMHVAFLRAHNALVARGHTYCEARALLRQHYQWIVIHDYLKRVADPAIVDDLLANPGNLYPAGRLFIPFEFSAAAFRFGHTMVRAAYDVNVNFPARFASLLRLFNVLGPYLNLPEKWLIQWENFVEGGTNVARRIDTSLVEPLSTLPGLPGIAIRGEISLAVRNLLRGYVLRIPTGQAVARVLSLPILSASELVEAAVSKEQAEVLESTELSTRTPLWFYILAEAVHFNQGRLLGPVGSTLVAGVLIGLIRNTKNSFLQTPNWTPSVSGTKFDLPDLLRLAGVLD
ncbi:MAG TPA: heme peroxidase family protein [Pyrinomonadaceae bacterium]